MLKWLITSALAITIAPMVPAALPSYAEVVAQVRAHPGPFAIYLGSPNNHLAKMLESGAIDTSGVPVAAVAAGDRIASPLTGFPNTGVDLQSLFQAGAGTIVFITERGVPMPELAIPQLIHGNDPDLLGLYFAYLSSRQREANTLPEFARALGKEQVLVKAYRRSQSQIAGYPIGPNDQAVRGRNALTGQEVDPLKEIGIFYLYTVDPNARVFLAQLHELWANFASYNIAITVICPTGMEPLPENLPVGFQGVLLQAPRDRILAQGRGVSPVMLFTGRQEGDERGVQMSGFQTAETVSRLFHVALTGLAKTHVNRDIPLGEVDDLTTTNRSDQ